MSCSNKIFLLIAIIFLTFNIKSQISITNSDFSSLSSTHVFSEVSIDQSLDFQSTGQNYNWDFTNIQYSKQDSISNVDVSSTPFLYQFYFNNFFLYPDYLASFAQDRIDFSDPLGILSLSQNFNYFKLTSSSLSLVGFGTTISINGSPGIPTSVRYDTIDQIFPLPLNYGVSDSTSAFYLASIPSFGSYGQSIKREVEVDGWGSLITPFNNYDVLRLKTTLHQTDTFYVDTFQFGNSIERPTLVIYEWWAKNISFPVMRVEYENNSITKAWYADQLHVGFNDSFESDLLFFPNPTTDKLMLNINASYSKDFSLYDITGHLVKRGKTNGEISVKNIPSGFYLISIEIDKKLEVFKFQKN
jgi:hypothetical protein